MKRRRDLKLRNCMNAFHGYGELPGLKTKSLRKVGETYERNIRRVYSLILFPPAAVHFAITLQRTVDRVERDMPHADHKAVGRETDVRVKHALAQQSVILKRGGAAAEKLIETQQDAAFKILGAQSPEFNDGPEAWMASQIIATWTAFEAMAEDLWEAALNAKPGILAKLARSKSQSKPSDDPKRIKLDWLHMYKYNVSKRMGTIFLQEKRYVFDNLKDIRAAYIDAFSEDFDKIDQIINDKSLDVLSLIRNNLAHNGGIIDQKYLSRSPDLPREALGKVGTPIQIDGELVANVVGPAMKQGHNLVVAVDDWLASH